MPSVPPLLARLLGFDSLPAPPHVFAVGPQELRYARFAPRSGGGFELQERHSVTLAPDTFAAGPIGGAAKDTAMLEESVGQLVAKLSTRIEQASLLLPDSWLRVTFVEAGELPRNLAQRDEVLRWKLKRIVPFRVEDLRLANQPVAPLPQQEEPERHLVAFALESLLAQLEVAFAAHRIWIGSICSSGLALLAALETEVAAEPLGAIASVAEGGYSLVFARRGEPVLYRHKALDGGAGIQDAEGIQRDLRLTRAFLQDQLPQLELGRVLLAAAPDVEARWASWLEAGLGRPVEVLGRQHLPLAADPSQPLAQLAPLFGAVRQEVA